MRTPREQFLASGHAAAFKAMLASESFEPACSYALLEMQSEMPHTSVPGQPTDPYAAIDANSQMKGAARVLAILQTMTEPVKSPSKPQQKKLNYAS